MNLFFKKILLFVFICSLPISSSFAQKTKPAPPCSAEENRQFDFWIGDWEVYSNDKVVGSNRVELILGSCVIQENWIGTGGSVGTSFNYYNPDKGTWNQLWVDNFGTNIHFEGNYADRKMTLHGKGVSRQAETKGAPVYYILTFHNNEDGTVRQHWEASYNMKEWKTLFDGLYKKK